MWTFVRHGETDWNAAGRLQGRTDIDLNDVGRQQARVAAQQLQGQRWDAVWASPLGRTIETAEIIADVLGLPAPHTHAGLVERSYGDGEGAFVKDRKQFVGEAERPEEVVARGLIALDDLYELHANDHLIIVSHGSFIRYMLDHITGIPTDRVENAEAKEFVYTPSIPAAYPAGS
ncbi:MAG: histidine phosphatase family protein [Canibacter sp.]